MRFDDWACIAVSQAIALQFFFLVNELSFSRHFVAHRKRQRGKQAGAKYPPKPRQIMMQQIMASRELNSPQRALAKTLTGVAVKFIANHELAHIVNGHLQPGVGSALSEDGQIDVSDDSELGLSEDGQTRERDKLLVYRTLEYDADALAMQQTLHHFIGVIRGDITNTSDAAEFFKDETDMVHTVFAGACIAMCVIEAVQSVTPESVKRYTHPPAIFRMFAIFSVAENSLRMFRQMGRFSLSDDAVYEALTRAAGAIEMALADRTRAQPDPFLLAKAFLMRSVHDAELYRCWARLRPKLEKRKLGQHKLAAAQYDIHGNPLSASLPELRHLTRGDD